ncbi:MAG: hypothetical protein KIS96_08050 [Bauldia sp.]|nr:hypothetical protein [Bauldia sp.]
MLRRSVLMVATASAFGVAASPLGAAVNVINGIGRSVTVQIGYSDENGNVSEWTAFTIEPCFYLTLDEAPDLRLLFPTYLDARINPDTGAIDYQVLLLTQPATLALFNADPLIMFDGLGRNDCGLSDALGDPAAPTPAGEVKK